MCFYWSCRDSQGAGSHRGFLGGAGGDFRGTRAPFSAASLFPVIFPRVSQDAVRALRVLNTLSACVHAPGRSLASVCSQRCRARAAAADTPSCQGRRRGPVLPEQRPCPWCPQCHPSGRFACTCPKEQPPFSERPGEHRAPLFPFGLGVSVNY